jgi:hypothetical protein
MSHILEKSVLTYFVYNLYIEKFSLKPILTLISAAGGVYDFEEVYLCNGLSSGFQNSCIPRKTSREYILLSTF